MKILVVDFFISQPINIKMDLVCKISMTKYFSTTSSNVYSTLNNSSFIKEEIHTRISLILNKREYNSLQNSAKLSKSDKK